MHTLLKYTLIDLNLGAVCVCAWAYHPDSRVGVSEIKT